MSNGQLAQIKTTIRHSILAMPEVSSISYDEAMKTIIITVDNENVRSEVMSKLPSALGGYSVDFQVMKKPQLLVDRETEFRPIPGGVSIGHQDVTAGTNAILVYNRQGQPRLLSNSHVFTPILQTGMFGRVGDPISQPGMLDSDGILMKCAELQRWTEPVNGVMYVDAAIAVPVVDIYDYVMGDTQPWSVVEAVKAEIGMNVKKAGRTTGVTHGKIIGTMVDTKATDANGYMLWQMLDQIRLEMEIAGGDSGSLLVTEDNKAVGLIWGGGGGQAMAAPIGYVMKIFDVGFSYPLQEPPEVPETELIAEAGMGLPWFLLLLSAAGLGALGLIYVVKGEFKF